MKTINGILAATISLAGLMAASQADAAVYFDIAQSGANVVVTVSGTFDTSLGSAVSNNYLSSGTGSIDSAQPKIVLNSGTPEPRYAFTSSAVFGSGGNKTFDTASGLHIGITSSGGGLNPVGSYFFISHNYVSNSAIAATGTVNNATLADLGLSKNIYSLSAGGNDVFIRIDQPVTPTPTPTPTSPTTPQAGVPEPATWAMMIVGFGLIGGAMRRRSAKISFA